MTKEEFRRWRLRLDITRKEAGARLGRSSRQVEAYERGETDIPTVIELATAELERRANQEAA
jgi:transcriptional regulator with XRE-family HTH domain